MVNMRLFMLLFLTSNTFGQLFKLMLLPGDFWPSHVSKTFECFSKIECGSHSVAEWADFFVYENETLNCFTGFADQTFEVLSDQSEIGKVYVNIEKLLELLNFIAVKLHTVTTENENWNIHVYKSESLVMEGAPTPFFADCAYRCFVVEMDTCDLFIFDSEYNCHMGNFSSTDGAIITNDSPLQVYFKTGMIALIPKARQWKIAPNQNK